MKIEEEARNAVEGKRQEEYGSPGTNHGNTALLWTAYIRGRYGKYVDLNAVDVCRMNQLQKFSRDMHEHHRDNSVDNIGYEINIAKILGEDK